MHLINRRKNKVSKRRKKLLYVNERREKTATYL
jgi:hypothetical protein